MTSELVVDVQPKEISIALLEDKNLVEFQREGRNRVAGKLPAACRTESRSWKASRNVQDGIPKQANDVQSERNKKKICVRNVMPPSISARTPCGS